MYIYLATITKAITFGGFLGDITGGMQVWKSDVMLKNIGLLVHTVISLL